MRLQQLEAFRMVARTLNLTRSAARLNYAQSSVTEQIQSLEAELGAALFERMGRRLRLTAAGERLLAYADQILALAEEARSAVSEASIPPATLTVAAPETLCVHRLPPVLASLRARAPQLRLVVRPASRAELHRAIPEGTADVCLGLGEAPSHHAIAVEQLEAEPLVLVASPGHPLAGRDAVTAAELRAAAWLTTERGCAYRDAFERGLGAAGPWPAMEVSSIRALASCVAAGQGVALVPEVAVIDELARGTLVCLPWEAPGQTTCAVWMAWTAGHAGANLAAAIAALRESLRPRAAPTSVLAPMPARVPVA